MPFKLTAKNCVVVGHFNAAIIKPPWLVKQGILPDGEMQLSLSDRPEAPRVFKFAGLDWQVGPTRLVVSPVSPDGVNPAVPVGQILRKLPHTPISAIGHNFIFDVEPNDPSLEPRLGSRPMRDLASKLGGDFMETSWSLAVQHLKGYRLTLKVQTGVNMQKADANFHFNVDSAEQAAELTARFDECGQVAAATLHGIAEENRR